MATQPKKQNSRNLPVILTYLLENIKKGLLPSEDLLSDIFDEIETKHYKLIALELLSRLQGTPDTPKDRGTYKVKQEAPNEATAPAQKRVKPKANANKVFKPGELDSGRASVITKG